jgi:hypothetical protein
MTILRTKMRKISLYDISIFVFYYWVLFDVYILIYLFIIMICRSILQHTLEGPLSCRTRIVRDNMEVGSAKRVAAL